MVFREALTWDDIGRIAAKDVSLQGTANRWEYAYDGASRLSQARRDGQSVGVWAYDGNGNRVSADGVAATFDAQDRQLTSGAVTFGHDAFGNRTRRTEGMQTTQHVYDGVGGLLSATLPDSTRLEYIIDSRGRRVGKKRNGVLEKGWLYDGQLRIVAELDGSGAVVSRFIYGTLSHSPDIMLRSGITYRYVHDVLGSVRLLINVATGQVAQRIDYDSWGVITSDSSPGFQPFGFAGGLHDPDTRLTRFGARDYDAGTGRWTSKDPIRFDSGAANIYSYVGGQIVDAIDPSGHSMWRVAYRVGQSALKYGKRLTRKEALRAVEAGTDVATTYASDAKKLAKDVSKQAGGMGACQREAHRGGKNHFHALDDLGRHLEDAGHIFYDGALSIIGIMSDGNENGVHWEVQDAGELLNPLPIIIMDSPGESNGII